MPTRVAFDAMGGDNAPAAVIQGALSAVHKAPDTLQVFLFGPIEQLSDTLTEHAPPGHPAITLVDAPQVIGMEESPVAAVRSKPNSSIHRALEHHRAGEADAFLSGGNTGAITAASLFVLQRLRHVLRPSIPTVFPTTQGMCLLLDVGSNMDSRPEHLLQFAQMGSAYYKHLWEVDSPSVGLLSVGEEPSKGNELVRAAYQLLVGCPYINFIGNIEGRGILHHGADVVVCDGFVGNVILKLAESVTTALPEMIIQQLASQTADVLGTDIASAMLSSLKRIFNPDTYGSCAPLLGVGGTVHVLHGSSDARAFESALGLARRAVSANLIDELERSVRPLD